MNLRYAEAANALRVLANHIDALGADDLGLCNLSTDSVAVTIEPAILPTSNEQRVEFVDALALALFGEKGTTVQAEGGRSQHSAAGRIGIVTVWVCARLKRTQDGTNDG